MRWKDKNEVNVSWNANLKNEKQKMREDMRREAKNNEMNPLKNGSKTVIDFDVNHFDWIKRFTQ